MTFSNQDQPHARRVESATVEVVLFDVGGVLVELRGIEVMRDWLGGTMTEEALWERWLRSETVRQFETGQIEAEEFAIGVTREFGLAIAPQRFLAAFEDWLVGPYPGTFEMLARIPKGFRRALLSNSNSLHWPRVVRDMRLGALFDEHFVSHLTGRIKPDAAAFKHVLAELGCAPQRVLFLDDNRLNIEAAASLGMQAIRVRGPHEAENALRRSGIL